MTNVGSLDGLLRRIVGAVLLAAPFLPWFALFLISMGSGILIARWLQALPRRQTA